MIKVFSFFKAKLWSRSLSLRGQLLMLAVCLCLLFVVLRSSKTAVSTGENDSHFDATERSTRKPSLKQSLSDRFLQAEGDPDKLCLLLPDLLQSNAFVDREIYGKFVNSFRFMTPGQIAFVMESWPDKTLVDIDGRFINQPSASELVNDIWRFGVTEVVDPSDIFDRGFQILEVAEHRGVGRRFLLRKLVTGSSGFTPEKLTKLLDLGLGHDEKLSVGGSIVELIRGESAENYFQLIDGYLEGDLGPIIEGAILGEVISSKMTKDVPLKEYSEWMLGLEGNYLGRAEGAFFDRAVQSGQIELAQDHVNVILTGDSKRKKSVVKNFAFCYSQFDPKSAIAWSMSLHDSLGDSKKNALRTSMNALRRSDSEQFDAFVIDEGDAPLVKELLDETVKPER